MTRETIEGTIRVWIHWEWRRCNQMFDSNDVRPPMSQASKMSPKEEAFCLAIVSGANASDAYRTAYRPQRAKAKTIHEKASRLMAKGKVRARIDELMAPVIAEAQMTRTEWLQWLTKCSRFDPRKLFDATVSYRLPNLARMNRRPSSNMNSMPSYQLPAVLGRRLPLR